MANVPTQLSPGVNITEIDLSGIVREAGNNISGFVGQFRWGPASQSLTIDTETRLTDTFLTPIQVSNNIKSDNDFFTVANYFRYSDKLKIVRVINENSKNAGCCAAAAILIHNEESFFKLADPTNNGSKNYAVVEPNSPWIARYPGDVGNSIKVITIGSGQFIQGNVNNGSGNNGDGNNNTEIPVVEPRGFILKKNGSLPTGVHQAFVTVPLIETRLHEFANTNVDFANRMIGDGSTLPSGNTFGMKYLCFYLRGSSYCNVPNTFPIPGGSYGNIPQSNGANGLSYDAFYRDNYFFGIHGEGSDQTDSGTWTENGPILAARLTSGITLNIGGNTIGRNYIHGKGFWNRAGDIGSWTHAFYTPTYNTRTLIGDGSNWTAHLDAEILRVPLTYGVNVNGVRYPTNQDTFFALGESNPNFVYPKINTTANLYGSASPYYGYQLYTPTCIFLPVDNLMGSGITEAYANDYQNAGELAGGGTYLYGNPFLATGGLAGARTATNYRNFNPSGAKVWKWTGTGVTSSATDNSCFPLRPVIDAFAAQANGGITASNARGMILMFAIPQTITGITSARLAPSDVGITLGTTLGIQFLVPYGITTEIGGITVWQSTNDPYEGDTNQLQMFFGFKGQFDTQTNTTPNTPISGLISDSVGGKDPDAITRLKTFGFQGSQAFPILETEWADIKDIKITKTNP